jgi:hypothetical protein
MVRKEDKKRTTYPRYLRQSSFPALESQED